ncbi:MAG: hypothetical protein FWD26_05510 [Treponema sp.]|nr:hypothetical protein [Treponema sp.]
MKKYRKPIIIISAFVIAVFMVLPVVFFVRTPVLIVIEQEFSRFYGEERIRKEAFQASLVLFRPVRTVVAANDASDDVVALAVTENSAKPFCVLFPLRFARSARIYREQNPQIPVVILEGRFTEDDSPAAFAVGRYPQDYFLYKTDIDRDFYRAGLAAAAFDNGKNGRIIVFLEQNIHSQAREAFLRGVNEYKRREAPENNERPTPTSSFFSSFSQFSETSNISCVVLTGTGIEYLERKTKIPVICFTWLAPDYIPDNVALIINDSPWSQVVQAVKMAKSGLPQGFIESKFTFINSENIDSRSLHKILKTW